MKVCRLIWHEVKMGLVQRKFFIFLSFFIALLAGQIFTIQIVRSCVETYPQICPSLSDVLLFCFKGKAPFYGGEDRSFQIPMLWMSIMLGAHIAVLGYGEEFTLYGQQGFIRCAKRRIWWAAKCIWNIVLTSIYFGTGIIGLILFSYIKRWKLVSGITGELLPYIFSEMPQSHIIPTDISIIRLILPIVTGGIAWNLFQMYLAVYVKSFLSLLVTIMMHLSSIYMCNWWLPGNYMMLARNRDISMVGAGTHVGWRIYFILSAIAVAGGMRYFKKCDYLAEGE